MRRTFADELLKQAKTNHGIIVVTMDLGYKLWDEFQNELPDQFYNLGASEQSALGISVGLALQGKIPFVYSITPFLLYRGFETIRNHIDHEKIGVRLVGSGRDNSYEHDGFSHDASDAKKILSNFKNIQCYWPKNKEAVPDLVKVMIETNEPSFISLKR